jgi:O-antigen/teichoic acid export membrane protein
MQEQLERQPSFVHNMTAVAKGGGVTFGGKLFLNGTRLLTAMLLARILGAEQLGMYSFALSALDLTAGLAIFGLDTALLRYIAILGSKRDEQGIWGTLQVGIGAAMLLSVITGTALYGLSFYIANSSFHKPELAPLLQLVSVFVPLINLSELLAGALRGFKRMDYPVIAQFTFQPVFRLVLIGLLLLSGLDAVWAIVTYGIADLAASLIMIYFLNKQFPLKRSLQAGRRNLRELLSFALPLWISEMMLKLKNNIQTLFLGVLSTVTGAGIFTVASQITMVSGDFSSAINTSSKPLIAELHAKGDIKQMGKIYQMANKWVVMVQLPVFLLMMLFPETLLSIFGESYTQGATVLMILAATDLLSMSTGMGNIIIDMTGYTKLKLINSALRLTVYIGLNLLLIPRWGMIGAAIAVLAGESFINLVRIIEVFYLYRIIPYNKSFIKPITAGVIALLSVLALGSYVPADANLVYALINMIFLFLVYAGVTLLLGFAPEELIMLGRFRGRIQTILARFKPQTP